MEKKRVIIIGAGFGGIATAEALKRQKNVEVLLIDRTNHHLFQPLLYQAATCILSVRDVASNLRQHYSNRSNFHIIMGEVVGIDKECQTVLLGNGDELDYDYLVVATGARHSYFGNPQWEELAPGLKTVPDALLIRDRLLTAFERAERLDSPEEIAKHLTFCIVGAGPTGVELAGTIAEFTRRTLKKNFRKIPVETSQIILIEGMDRILPPFHKNLSSKAQTYLEKMGVKVWTNKIVTEINEDGIFVGDTFIPCGTVLWAAGNAASPLLKTLDTELDRQGRAIVTRHLTLPEHNNIYVIGDAAHFKPRKHQAPLPAVASVAKQAGTYVGKRIKNALLETKKRKKDRSFRYLDKGSLATIGKCRAVAEIGKLRLAGHFAWLIWAFVHIAYLINFQSRIYVCLEWIHHHLTGRRTSRIIYTSIEEKLPKKPPKHSPKT